MFIKNRMSRPTLVTAFFDIQRSQKGDGRTVDEYLSWIKKTLQLNCNLYVFTEAKFETFFREHRPVHYPMKLVIIEFKDLYFYKYHDQMLSIINDADYKARIQHPGRIECTMPEYNIIQYSKFDCLNRAIDENIFNSTSFFWIDAGASRFFEDVDISKPYPGEQCLDFLVKRPDVFIIQSRHDLTTFPIDDEFIWKSDNLLCGTLFGGGANVLKTVYCELVGIFENQMLAKNNVNNEQLALAMLWSKHPDLFYNVPNRSAMHLLLFGVLSG
jgi:hypothetical protein